METKIRTKKTSIKSDKATPKKKISKAWKAAMKSQGSVEIIDMDALFNPICY